MAQLGFRARVRKEEKGKEKMKIVNVKEEKR